MAWSSEPEEQLAEAAASGANSQSSVVCDVQYMLGLPLPMQPETTTIIKPDGCDLT